MAKANVSEFDPSTLVNSEDSILIYDGTYYTLRKYKTTTNTHVLVKSFKSESGISEDSFEQLITIGQYIYVAKYLGKFKKDGKVSLVFESAPKYVTLRDHLRAYKEDSARINKKELINCAIDIGKGLQHLVINECFHPDLTAANILMNGENIKIVNYEYPSEYFDDYYMKRSDEIRRFLWLAPETCTKKKFDEQTIVWSFGVLLWEIFTLGASPYPGHSSISKYRAFIKQRLRMNKPKLCSTELYKLMDKCWKLSPNERPNLQEVLKALTDLEKKLSNESTCIPNDIEADDYDIVDGYDSETPLYF